MTIVFNPDSQVHEDLPQDQATSGLQSGAYHVALTDPQGNPVTAPLTEAQQLISQGYKQPTPSQIKSLLNESKNEAPTEKAKAALEGAASAATFGLSVPIEQGMGVKNEDILRRQESPYYGAGQVGGLALSSLAGVGEGAILSHAGESASGALGLGGEGAGIMSSMGAGVIKMGVESSLMSAGDENARFLAGDPDQTLQSAAMNVGLSGVMGGVIGAPLGAVKPVWNSTIGPVVEQHLNDIKNDAGGILAGTSKKVLSILGGVPEKEINAYVSNQAEIAAAPELHQVYDFALDHIQRVNQAVQDKAMDLASASSAMDKLKDDLTFQLRQQKFSAADAAAKANDLLSNAKTDLEVKLKSDALDKAGDVATAVKQLREQMLGESYAAREELSNVKKDINMKLFYKGISQMQEELLDKGNQEAAGALQKFSENLQERHGDIVRPGMLKTIIQGLDERTTFTNNAASFGDSLNNYYTKIRRLMDQTLKGSSEKYEEMMKSVADKAGLLNQLDRYGTQEGATSSISSLTSEAKYRNEMPLLKKLEAHTGNDFTNTLDAYANKQTRATRFEALEQSAKAQQLAEVLHSMRDPETTRLLENEIANSSQAQEVAKAREALLKAKQEKEMIKGVTPASLQGKMEAAMRGKIDPNRVLESFPKHEGKTLPEVLDLIRTKQAFTKGAMNGSRNVNLFGMLGGAIGTLSGHTIGGGAAGAAIGSAVDKYGPAITKNILDKYIEHFDLSVKNQNKSAVRWALSKVIDSAQPVSAAGFKALVTFAAHSIAGETHLNNAVGDILSGKDVRIQLPKKEDRDRLESRIDEINKNPGSVIHAENDLGYYSPSHNTSIAAVSTRAAQVLAQLKPKTAPLGPLDPEREPSESEKRDYTRALNLAENNLTALQYLKDGTLTSKDVSLVKMISPSWYQSASNKLQSEMIDRHADGKNIPYNIRMGLSLFTGQPLDASMRPQAILSNQMSLSAPSLSQNAVSTGRKPALGPMKNVKTASRAATQTNKEDEA